MTENFYGSDHDDCIHIQDDDVDYVIGLGGSDVIVIEGVRTGNVFGDYKGDERDNDGNDRITILGDYTQKVFGGGGNDYIKMTGSSIGPDYGLIYGGSGFDSCYAAYGTTVDCE